MAAGLLAAFLVLVSMRSYFMKHFMSLMEHSFEQVKYIGKGSFELIPLLLWAIKEVAYLSLPVLSAVLIIGVLSNLAQSGFIFTGEQLKPDIKKINPVTKLKQWFSIKSLQELGKSLAKILLAGFIGWLVWKGALQTIITSVLVQGTMHDEALQLMAIGAKIISSMFWKILILYVVVAFIDFMFQKKNYLTEHKMTDKEVRDEYKNQEGDPYMKAKRRQMAQQIAMNQSAEHVPESDVVVINPTELAIALKYDPAVSPVPYVLSKGDVRHADDIRESARKNGIPVVRNKPLARALFDMCEIGDIVPEDLYKPVAEVLAYVFALKDQAPAPAADPTDAAVNARHSAATTTPPGMHAGEPIHDLNSIQVPVPLPQPGVSAPAAGWASPATTPHAPQPLVHTQQLPPLQWSTAPVFTPDPAQPWADQIPHETHPPRW